MSIAEFLKSYFLILRPQLIPHCRLIWSHGSPCTNRCRIYWMCIKFQTLMLWAKLLTRKRVTVWWNEQSDLVNHFNLEGTVNLFVKYCVLSVMNTLLCARPQSFGEGSEKQIWNFCHFHFPVETESSLGFYSFLLEEPLSCVQSRITLNRVLHGKLMNIDNFLSWLWGHESMSFDRQVPHSWITQGHNQTWQKEEAYTSSVVKGHGTLKKNVL